MKPTKNFWQRITAIVELIVSSYKARKGDPNAWESTIRKFEIQDHLQPPAKNSILFIGSSSINFWSTLAQDMAPLPVINRGFGGSYMRDMVTYLDRIVLPYQPRAIVLFAGTNDTTDNQPDTARTIFEGYKIFVQRVHAALPQIPIYYIAITPAPTRRKLWPIADEANQLILDYTEKDTKLHFIDFNDQLLDESGKPDRSFYKFDGIHPNEKGYAIWTAAIKPYLE
jgi:lysophospholipase L1-like esterase